MKRKRITYFIIGLSLFSIFVYGLLTARKEILRTFPKTPSSKKLAEPYLPSYISGKLPISTSLKKEDFNFPGELGLLEITNEQITESEAKQIALNLKFSEEPLIAKDIKEGTKFIWSTKKNYLFITPSTSTIKYGLNTQEPPKTVNKKLTPESLIDIADSILSQNQIIAKEKIKFVSFDYLKVNSLSEGFQKTTQAQADIYQLNFTNQELDYEILTILPSQPLIFVQILPDGTVFSFQVIRLKSVVNTKEKYIIKKYEELLSDMENAKIVNLFNQRINLSEVDVKKITSIEIDQIKLAYLLDSTSSKYLQPVFLLEGKVKITDSTADRAQLYLPAIKNN